MGYSAPPLVIGVNTLTTAAVNTDVVRTILAAAGVGTRYRVVGMGMILQPDMTGIIQVDQVSGNISIGGAVSPQTPSIYIPFPEPGFQLADNQSITVQCRSNVAAQRFTAWFFFFTDAVS